MTLSVRPATRGDVDGIATAYIASWRAAYAGLLPVAVLEAEVATRAAYDWANAIDGVDRHVAVAVAGNDVVGVVEAAEAPGGARDLPEITMLYVAPSHWGTSAASLLHDAACGWITGNGHVAARLRVVRPHRRARRFYERKGWRKDPTLPSAHNGLFDLLHYRRDLSPEAVPVQPLP